jgi:hypothetical protein
MSLGQRAPFLDPAHGVAVDDRGDGGQHLSHVPGPVVDVPEQERVSKSNDGSAKNFSNIGAL